MGEGSYAGLLPRPEPSAAPVELYASLVDPHGAELARSPAVTVAVSDSCNVRAPPVPGEEWNLTLGETSSTQGPNPPDLFECTGIVTREYKGRLYQDAICRDYFVPFQSREPKVIRKSGRRGSARFHNVKIFYGTDRERTGSKKAEEYYGGDRGPLEFGTCQVTIPVSHEVGELETPGFFERPDPEEHIILLSVTPSSEGEFLSDLSRHVATDAGREVLIFIHGYNVSFEDAARRTAQLAADLKFSGAPVMYSWPSQASLSAYPIDEANIRWTEPHLRRFLDIVAADSGASRIHLIAHSMGNRALTEVLLNYANESRDRNDDKPIFNQIALVAPDVDADVFREEIVPRIQRLSDRLTLYASSNDKALLVSKGVHGYPRAGDLPKEVVVPATIDMIDASEVDTSLLAAIELGHSYFAEQPTVIDDLRLMIQGVEPGGRGLVIRQLNDRVIWKIGPD